MHELNDRDVSVDADHLDKLETFMRHGRANVPDYMLSVSRGDYAGVGDIHFFYSADEALYGAKPEFEAACQARGRAVYNVRPAGHGALLLHAAVFQRGQRGFRQNRGYFERVRGFP